MEKKLDLRIEKTYLALHNSFTALLEEKHFEDFTVNELCDRAMIRRTTFYKHFADKYEYFSFYMKEVCAEFQDQLPPDIMSDSVNDYFLYMCRELLRFIDKHEKLVKNVMNSTMLPVLMDSLMAQIMYDVLDVLRGMNVSKKMTTNQMESMAAFYSGGIVNNLRLAMSRCKKIEEDEFISSMAGFLRHEMN